MKANDVGAALADHGIYSVRQGGPYTSVANSLLNTPIPIRRQQQDRDLRILDHLHRHIPSQQSGEDVFAGHA